MWQMPEKFQPSTCIRKDSPFIHVPLDLLLVMHGYPGSFPHTSKSSEVFYHGGGLLQEVDRGWSHNQNYIRKVEMFLVEALHYQIRFSKEDFLR